jgi:hypothetical protein
MKKNGDSRRNHKLDQRRQALHGRFDFHPVPPAGACC